MPHPFVPYVGQKGGVFSSRGGPRVLDCGETTSNMSVATSCGAGQGGDSSGISSALPPAPPVGPRA